MIYDPKTDPQLKSWLVKNLEPICDAEPGALADYILALLKHNAAENELRVELGTQLEEFLEKETQHFINLLFNAIRSQSYLPYNTSPPPTPTQSYNNSNPSVATSNAGGIPIPLNALVPGPSNPSNPRKRGLDNPSNEYEYRKGPRLSNDPGHLRPGRGGRGQWDGRGGGRVRDSSFGEPSGEYGGNRSQQYRPPDQTRRGICRDYHNNGYCSRGAYCKYSHGDDAVVPSQLMGMGGIPQVMLPFMSMMNGAMFPGMNNVDGGSAYDPNERMDMQRAPMIRRQDVPVPTSGELPVIQDLTPWASPNEQVSQQNPDSQQPGQSNMVADPTTQQDHAPPGQFGRHPQNQGQGSRGRRGRGGSWNNGTFPSRAIPSDPFNILSSDSQSQQPPRPDRRQDKTLVVEKIPEDRLSLGAVNDWFKQFGTVTNVAVDPPTAKALVTFAEHDQAWKAWKSEEAVFGNRFVKVYWHRPLEGRGGRGMKALEVSATLVGKLQGSEEHAATQLAANGDAGPAASSSTVTAPPNKPTKSTSNALQELTEKQERLQQMIAEQKALMSQLGTATAEGKKEVMAKLRKLGEDMKAPVPTPSTEKQEDVEMEKGDQETNKKEGGEGDGQEESTEELQAKLAKLKEEAASLGIPEADQSYSLYGGYTRPWRGRGRGRGGHFRARGGPPRASMKLDNRPRKLLVKGVPEESVEVAENWYGTTNGVENVERLADGDLILSFKTRNSAEQGYAKGTNLPTVGQITVSWYSPGPGPSKPTPSLEQPVLEGMGGGTTGRGSALVDKSVPEEETVASGWGDDGEDGMGML
ncbi:hypothetical protein BDM02DRAFT_3091413 [Thelephora ganbajun]|uniref:Uncharacterized protein n=1 Tax=Thelephora ganbajun TaxID=370292 RepID=A0ACB6ZPD9_THEGA|nr:hypothetical protein BDM02DRAFT_3091413 [Thelephora ganbajun]